MPGKRVLIIDDEENMRHMLQTMLDKAGYMTGTAADGAEGLDLMDRERFDFILCDLKMHGLHIYDKHGMHADLEHYLTSHDIPQISFR